MTCKTCNLNSVQPAYDFNKKIKELTLSNQKCGKEVLSISRVDDNIIITYADCTYSVVSADKVDKSVIETSDLAKRINSLEEKLKDLTIKAEDRITVYSLGSVHKFDGLDFERSTGE